MSRVEEEQFFARQLEALKREEHALAQMLIGGGGAPAAAVSSTTMAAAASPPRSAMPPEQRSPGVPEYFAVAPLPLPESQPTTKAAGAFPSPPQTRVGAFGVIDQNVYNSKDHTLPNKGADNGASLQDKLRLMHQQQRAYETAANKAMNTYFKTVQDHDGYTKKRAKQLKDAKPFTFEKRELMKAQRIGARRQEEERKEAEREAARQRQFRAAPVPAGTFMNKYDVMVEEWCERKAAALMLAKERADIAKEEKAYIQEAARGLQQARAELMGATYDAEGHAITRSAARRAKSAAAERAERHVTFSTEVPLEVKMKFWPALKEHEQLRKERIKVIAAEKKKDTDEHFKKVMPLLSSPPPATAGGVAPGAFGIGGAALQQQPILAADPHALPAAPGATDVPLPLAPPGGALPLPTSYPMAPGASTSVSGLYGSIPLPQTDAPALPGTSTQPPTPSMTPPPMTAADGTAPAAAPGTGAEEEAKKKEEELKKHKKKKAAPPNKECTFKPRIKPGMPDYDKLWAEERVALLERKKKQPPTVPVPFVLTPSERARPVGKRPAPRRVGPPPPRARSAPATGGKSAEGVVARVPKGTRAHALRTEAVYVKYIHQMTGGEEEAEMKEREAAAQREREVRERLAPYLINTRSLHEAEIQDKVRALRQAARETEAAAQQRLAEMRERVAQLPPVFAEPEELNDLAKMRLETEQNILKMLKETGLDGATIKEILAARPDKAAAADGSSGGAGDGAGTGDGDAKDGEHYSDDDFSDDDKSGDSKSDSDDFESSSSDDSDSSSGSGSSSSS